MLTPSDPSYEKINEKDEEKLKRKQFLAAKIIYSLTYIQWYGQQCHLIIYYLSEALYRAPLKLTFLDCPVKDKSQNLCLFCFILASSSAQSSSSLQSDTLQMCIVTSFISIYIHSFIPWIFNDKLLKRSEPSLFCSLLYVQLQEQYLTVSHSSYWMNEWSELSVRNHTDCWAGTFPNVPGFHHPFLIPWLASWTSMSLNSVWYYSIFKFLSFCVFRWGLPQPALNPQNHIPSHL